MSYSGYSFSSLSYSGYSFSFLGSIPTPVPTTTDFATVDTEMQITADDDPTGDDALALKETIAAQTGVPIDSILDFQITSNPISGQRRRLSNVVWIVTFQISVSISESYCGACGTSAVDFAVYVQETCASRRFNRSYKRHCNSCDVIPETVVSIPKTRAPTPQPYPRPTLKPTRLRTPQPVPQPTPKPTNKPVPQPTPEPSFQPTEACVCICPTKAPTKPPTQNIPSCKEKKTVIVPEKTEATLQCAQGTIKVTQSFYTAFVIGTQLECTTACTNTAPITKELCNDKRTCTVVATNAAMQADPSPGKPKSLLVNYCCWR